MSDKTDIPYTHHTWSPWIGCEWRSPACDNCYADLMDQWRFSKTLDGGTKEKPIRHFGKGAPRHLTVDWKKPLHWNKRAASAIRAWEQMKTLLKATDQDLIARGHIKPEPVRVMPSMCDWLDRAIPIDWRIRFLNLIVETPYLVWLLFTKRPELWYSSIDEIWKTIPSGSPIYNFCRNWLRGEAPSSVWFIVTTESQEQADFRIPHALKVPALVHGLSIEPMLGPINLESNKGGTRWIGGQRGCGGTHRGIGTPDCPKEPHHHHDDRCNPGINWVIVGGESGPKARPMHPLWAQSIQEQCAAADVPFWFKQWGEWAPRSKCCGGPEDFGKIDPQCKKWRTIRLTESGKDGRQLGNADDGEDVYMQRVGLTRAGSTLFGKTYTKLPKV